MIGLSSCGANAQGNAAYTNMDVNEFASYLKNDNVQLVDVRTPEEYVDGHISGSRNIDVFDPAFIKKAQESLDTAQPVAVYCRSGKRSADAADKLAAKGYKVVNLEGGIMAWERARKPIVSGK